MIKLEVIGNLGGDATVKEINGKDYVAMSVACSLDKEKTVWVSALWSGDGGALLPMLKSGAKVFLRGNMTLTEYLGKDGATKTGVNLFVSEIFLCGLKGEVTVS